ncbi:MULTISPECIES: glycoside hydrolase domain-containing protein [unclassified Bradyrhizobium]
MRVRIRATKRWTRTGRSGLYLTHAPARSVPHKVDEGWIAAAGHLAKSGWGIAPIYVGAEPEGSSKVPPPSNPLADAQTDAAEAVALAQRAGFQPGRTIFLDVEQAFLAHSPYESYVLKWLEQVQASGYRTALYCFPKQLSWCAAHGIPIWTVHLNKNTGTKDRHTGVITWSYLTSPLPTDPINAGAISTQGRFYCRAAELKLELDYDRWTVADPSHL